MGNWKSKEQESPQVKRIVDRVWDRFVSVSECGDRLGLQDLYCAILLVYNDINKTIPGPWNDPPERQEVEEMLKMKNPNQGVLLSLINHKAYAAEKQGLQFFSKERELTPKRWNRCILRKFDKNHDGQLDRDDFTAFLQSFTKNMSTRISTNILIFSFVIPLVVGATRRFTERLRKVGSIVRRIPNVIFSSLVTAAIVMVGTHLRARRSLR